MSFSRYLRLGLASGPKQVKFCPRCARGGLDRSAFYLETAGPRPEAFAFLCHKGSIAWNCLEDLKELPQLQQHLRQAGTMAGVFCLYRDHGSHTEHLVMTRDNEAVSPEGTVECLNAVSTVLYTALYRRPVEIEMERLRHLEQTVGSIASEFVHMTLNYGYRLKNIPA